MANVNILVATLVGTLLVPLIFGLGPDVARVAGSLDPLHAEDGERELDRENGDLGRP